jgi:Na+/H+-translocating membrane pyrophosphatase
VSGQKGSDAHTGPSMNILIKLISVVSLVIAPLQG